MIDLRRLRTLREIGQRGSFSAAAEALHYTQAAVSQQIAHLERELGIAVVDRSVRPLRLTDAGVVLVERAEAAFGELAAAEADVAAIRSAEAGALAVGFFASAGATLLAPALTAFVSAHPHVTVATSEGASGELARSVRAGELDLALVTAYAQLEPTLEPSLERTMLCEDPFSLIVPREHPLARRRHVPLQALAHQRLIAPTPSGPVSTAYTRLLDQACARAGFTPDVVYRISDCQTAQALVAAGHGVAVFPELALHPLAPGVVARRLSGAPAPRHVLVLRRAGAQSPVALAFLDVLRETAADRVGLTGVSRRPRAG